MSDLKSPTIGPWVCPYCGTLGNHTHCDGCYAVRPYQMPAHNDAGSYFSILHGPIGFWGLPSVFAIALVFFWFMINFTAAVVSQNSLYELRQSRPVRNIP